MIDEHGRDGSGTRASMARPPNLENLHAFQLPAHHRPLLVPQHSSSLPSTPMLSSRQLASEGYRTPSPSARGEACHANDGTDVTSPRSARSEPDGTLRLPNRGGVARGGCPFESGMAFYRRRIPYSLGGDKLETSDVKVKRKLDSTNEQKLNEDITRLYESILPTVEDDDRRAKFVAKLERILNDRWPGNEIKVHVFGSSGNLLATKDSDVDICITTPMKALEKMCLLARTLAEHGMQNVVCVPSAKVPIVKIWDPELQLACDMNVNNTLALENTRMIRTYVQIDPRVRPLAMVVKYWSRRRILNDAALGGTLSSYTWILMIVHFLQCRERKILPTLQHRPPHERRLNFQGKISEFSDDLNVLHGFGSKNNESLAQLLFGFFRRYAHEVDYERSVISVREGSLVSKEAKNWHQLQNNRLCVEEPFNTIRNLGNTADDISFRGIHLELRRAFDLIEQGKLDECCEQYEFPPAEERVWTKPTPQPVPILSRSRSQSGRSSKSNGSNGNGSGSSKANASGSKHRGSNGSSRRASSAAAPQKMSFYQMPLLSGYMPAVPTGKSGAGGQIHDHLYQQYQYLQAQEAHLRHQMQQQKAHLNPNRKMSTQLQSHMATMPKPQQVNLEGIRRNSNIEPPPLSAPLRAVQSYYYPTPPTPGRNMTGSTPKASSRSITNPPSPLIGTERPVMPDLRQGLHRSTSSDNHMSSARSRSQPPLPAHLPTGYIIGSRAARAQHGPPMTPSQGPIMTYNTLQDYQRAWLLQQRYAEMTAGITPAESPRQVPIAPDPVMEDRYAKEYIGYYVDQNHQAHPIRRDLFSRNQPPFPPWTDQTPRANGMPHSVSRIRADTTSSRTPSPSPSPASFSRTRSTSVYSTAPVPAVPLVAPGRATPTIPKPPTSHPNINGQPAIDDSSPVIVDGSNDTYDTDDGDYLSPPECGSGAATNGDEVSLSDGLAIDTPLTTSAATPSHDSLDTLDESLDVDNRIMPNVLQFGDLPVTAAVRNGPSPPREPAKQSAEQPCALSSMEVNSSGTHASGLGIDMNSLRLKDLPVPGPSSSSAATTPAPLLTGPALAATMKQGPLLSPVREIRTPSPATVRRIVPGVAPLNTGCNGELPYKNTASSSSKDKAPSSPAASASPRASTQMTKVVERSAPQNGGVSQDIAANTAKSPIMGSQSQWQEAKPSTVPPAPKSPTVASQGSGWQQTVSKKNKHRKKSSLSGSVTVFQGAEEERKGG